MQLLSALFLSLCAALVLLAGTRRVFSPFIHREVLNETGLHHPPVGGVLVNDDTDDGDGGLCHDQLLFPAGIQCSAARHCADRFGDLGRLCRPFVCLDLVERRSRPPAERLAPCARFGWQRAFAGVVDLRHGGGQWPRLSGRHNQRSDGSPIVLTVFKSLIASIIIGLILMAMSLIKPIVPAGETLDSQGKPWPRAVWLLFVLTGAALIIAGLSGYVGLARFVATQIVMTGAILVTMYIGILTGKAVAKQNALADTVVGRYLEKRFRMEQIGLDQAGLVAGLGIYALVILFFIPLILLQWGFQIADIQSWAYRIFTEIKIGGITISITGILAGILLFAAIYVVTRWFQRWLDGSVMARSRIDPGVRNSVKTGVGYLGLGLAGLMAISAAGLDLSNLALVAGALSLGVGFGLQNIVSNFVSGLILLVERPFKVGDWVVTGTTEGFVRRISVRATEIETFQRQTIMVPNSLFINASVGNWTHRNKLGRSDIPVTVGYDAVPRQVMDTLLQIAAAHPLVLKNPEPLAVFTTFGETTMTFELRVYLADIVNGNGVRNDLRLAIYERFREEGLGAPFPKDELEPEEPMPELASGRAGATDRSRRSRRADRSSPSRSSAVARSGGPAGSASKRWATRIEGPAINHQRLVQLPTGLPIRGLRGSGRAA